MEIEKKSEKKVSFNLSPSSLNVFYQSPLLFYLTYIAKVPDDTPIPLCYGLSGNLVHKCLEKYAKKELDKDGTCIYLINCWEKLNLNNLIDLNGNPLNQIEYLIALLNGIQLIDEHENHICEEIISFPFKENENMKIGLKGVMDLQATKKGESAPIVIDFKTSNNIRQDNNFEYQALFYNLLLHKKKKILPSKTIFYYLKSRISKNYEFNLEQIEEFHQELHNVADSLLSFGTNIEEYPIGEIESVFNSKKKACLREIERRRRLDSI